MCGPLLLDKKALLNYKMLHTDTNKLTTRNESFIL